MTTLLGNTLECLFWCSRVSIPWSSPTLTIMIIHFEDGTERSCDARSGMRHVPPADFSRWGTLLSNSVPDCRKFLDFLFKTTIYIVFNLSIFSIYFLLMKINIFTKQILNDLYILLVFTLFVLGVFFVHTRYGHLLWIQVTEIILTLLLETHFKSKS